jgi:hypothetical protein
VVPTDEVGLWQEEEREEEEERRPRCVVCLPLPRQERGRGSAAVPVHVARQVRAHVPLACRAAVCGTQRLPTAPRRQTRPKRSTGAKNIFQGLLKKDPYKARMSAVAAAGGV